MSDVSTQSPDMVPGISFWDATLMWLKIGVLSFGGPAAQIALMHRTIVDEARLLNEKQFLGALSFCMLLPGPEAMQLATYAGWRLHGIAGGLVAGLSFVVPGAIVVLALAMLYTTFGDVTFVDAAFTGIKAAVVIIVIGALIKICRKALKSTSAWIAAGLGFVAIFFFDLPFPIIIFLSGLAGFILSTIAERGRAGDTPEGAVSSASNSQISPASSVRTLQTVLLLLVLWWAPVALLHLFAPGSILVDLGLFFSKLAVVTFGGAYAVLAYMAQDVVDAYGWLDAGQMLVGLGLAETTPGPLILVTEFVGYVAAWSKGGVMLGLAGAAVVLWVTFMPCFLWIFAGAPYLEKITGQPRLMGALNLITAAVVGVILNLSIWFSLHIYFADVVRVTYGAFGVWQPDISTLNFNVVGLSILCGLLLLWRSWSIHWVLALSAGLAVALSSLGMF